MPSQAPDPEPEPTWTQQTGESAKAYAAFALYRDMDPADRSLHAAYRRHSGYEAALRQAEAESDPIARAREVENVKRSRSPRASGGWCDWYFKWGWRDRATEYDADQDRTRLAGRQRQRRDLRDRKVSYGRLLVGRAVPALNGIQPQSLSWQEGLVLLGAGLKLESEGLGDTLDVPEGQSVAKAEESYIDRIHRLKAERDARSTAEDASGG